MTPTCPSGGPRCPADMCDCFIDLHPDNPDGLHPEYYAVQPARTPTRIQLRRTKGWRLPENAVRVARPSRWGNPFWVDHGSVVGQTWGNVRGNWGRGVFRWPEALYTSSSNDAALESCIDKFRILCTVSERDYPTRYAEWIAPLRGKDLACWCKPTDLCHADVLLELANS